MGDQAHSLGDRLGIPQAPILLGKRDQDTIWAGVRRPARVDQQHEREEPRDFAVLRKHLARLPRQPDRLTAELGAVRGGAGRCRVDLVDNQVQDVQHRGEPL